MKLIDDKTPRWGAPRLSGIAEHMKTRLGQVRAGQRDQIAREAFHRGERIDARRLRLRGHVQLAPAGTQDNHDQKSSHDDQAYRILRPWTHGWTPVPMARCPRWSSAP